MAPERLTIKWLRWLIPHDNQHASNAPPLKRVDEEVCGVAWLCDPDRTIMECNIETDDGIEPVEWLGVKNLSPVAKGM